MSDARSAYHAFKDIPPQVAGIKGLQRFAFYLRQCITLTGEAAVS